MKIIKHCLLWFLPQLVLSIPCDKTKLEGYIIDSDTNTPVAYANVYFENSIYTTTSDINGKFTLTINDSMLNNSLVVSHLSYKTRHIHISSFDKEKYNTIMLKPTYYQLSNLSVKPKKIHSKQLGYKYKKSTKYPQILGFKFHILGEEIGIIIESKRFSQISKLRINIYRNEIDSIFLRLNIYDVKSPLPKQTSYSVNLKDTDYLEFNQLKLSNRLTQPVYISVTNDDVVNNELCIDLTKYNITIDSLTLITLETVKDLGQGNIIFCATDEGVTFCKNKNCTEWTSIHLGICMNIDVIALKK